MIRPARAKVPATFHAKLMLPFAAPILVTFVLLALVGDQWPRDIAPGSGLKIAGLCTTAVSAFACWLFAVRAVDDRRVRGFAALLCAITGLMGWPVWSVGVLPSINGSVLAEPSAVRMTVERTEATHKSKSKGFYHWVWLKADTGNARLYSGRYFISEDVYERLNRTTPDIVTVNVARGLLGAQIVTGLE